MRNPRCRNHQQWNATPTDTKNTSNSGRSPPMSSRPRHSVTKLRVHIALHSQATTRCTKSCSTLHTHLRLLRDPLRPSDSLPPLTHLPPSNPPCPPSIPRHKHILAHVYSFSTSSHVIDLLIIAEWARSSACEATRRTTMNISSTWDRREKHRCSKSRVRTT